MLILLDTTVLSNFARVRLNHLPQLLWGDQVFVALEVIEEYKIGIQTVGLPPDAWQEMKILRTSAHEQALEQTMPQRLGKGERASIAIACVRGAAFATDDSFARQVAHELGIQVTGTVGILQRCIQRKLLSFSQAQKALDVMIVHGYRSPTRSLIDE